MTWNHKLNYLTRYQIQFLECLMLHCSKRGSREHSMLRQVSHCFVAISDVIVIYMLYFLRLIEFCCSHKGSQPSMFFACLTETNWQRHTLLPHPPSLSFLGGSCHDLPWSVAHTYHGKTAYQGQKTNYVLAVQ